MTENTRIIRLSDRPNHLRRLARQELSVLSVYHNDDCSRRQALLLLQDEYSRWNEAEKQGLAYSPTSLAYGVIAKINKQFQQRVSCGFVTIAMLALENAGLNPSLERAAQVVHEYNNAVISSEAYLIGSDGSLRVEEKDLLSDIARIKQAFRKHRSVAHILGTQIGTGNTLVPTVGFEQTPHADAYFYNALMYFQQRIFGLPDASEWDLWKVEISPPFNPNDYPVHSFNESIENIVRPWIDAGLSPLEVNSSQHIARED